MEMNAPISVLIPTWRRVEQLCQVLGKILNTVPSPREILVHIDAGDSETAKCLIERFSDKVILIQSDVTQGPGGGRNRLLAAASQPYYASFDDDSWPLDKDYFAVACELLNQHENVGIITSVVCARGEVLPSRRPIIQLSSSFEGGGHIGRVSAFGEISGYVPLRYAYGLEEADVVLQLYDQHWQILRSGMLRVFHDTDLTHHAGAPINAAQIRNTGLKVFLRYPLTWWPVGMMQVINRVYYSLRNRRVTGVVSGIFSIPKICWTYRKYRKVVSSNTLQRLRTIQRNKSKG